MYGFMLVLGAILFVLALAETLVGRKNSPRFLRNDKADYVVAIMGILGAIFLLISISYFIALTH